ncbi:MAG: S-layer homology domain-containing protein [Lachnospiraceae bacterium]|jgi:hypothetical protein|nr:S-layer homology domain-containing protein [Lachnospiraceae bacterium]
MKLKPMVSYVLAVVAASACPISAMADSTYDLRKRVVELTGIMNVENGSRYVSRAEFAAMLVRASEYRSTVSQASSVSVFADVPVTSEYAPHIRIAARQGWMKGYLGGQFLPEEYITFQDAAKALLALLGYTNEDFTGEQNGSRMAKFSYLELNEELGMIQADEILTEDNCLNLFYNLLKAKPKGSNAIYGSIMDLTMSTDNELNPLEMLDTSVKGPYVVKKNRTMSSQLPFSMDKASFYLDGKPCTKTDIKTAQEEFGYVVMYYNASSKTVWVYTEEGSETTGKMVIKGEVTNIYYQSSDVMTPTAVTITTDDGDMYECSLTTSDLQFAFSIYGTVQVGDDVILVCSGSSESEEGDVTYRVTDFLED